MWLKAAVEGNNHNLKEIILHTDNGVHAVAIFETLSRDSCSHVTRAQSVSLP